MTNAENTLTAEIRYKENRVFARSFSKYAAFFLAKDFNFDTMHPLDGQGVHFW